jgi:hypothetical protein
MCYYYYYYLEDKVKKKNSSIILAVFIFLDIYFKFDTNGHLSTRHYDRNYNFNFVIINYSHLDSNIPTAPAYGFYVKVTLQLAVCIQIF